MKFCLYYSLYEWFNPMYLHDKKEKFRTQEFVEVHLAENHSATQCLVILGCFSRRTRTSLKTQLLFKFSEHSNFQPFPSQKAAYRQTNSLRTACILAFPLFVNVLILHFASLLDVLFLQCGLQTCTFQAASFRRERTVSLSRLAKVFKLISICNLHP